ncbi:MAG: adenine phosphoribosyltransferase [Candidatus Aldehydirespiratoraceae bacterium]|jgi:adenine phosphoribosyltransferase
MSAAAAERFIRDIPDFPEPGIVYKDITPLLADPTGFDAALTAMTTPWHDAAVDVVVGIEARGFIFGAPIARALGVSFVPVRKPGKLPFATASVDYGLEYGTDTLEMHTDAVSAGQKVLVIDDVLATGGTASAAVELINGQGGDVVGFGFLLELGFLAGRSKLGGARIESFILYGDIAGCE